MRRLLAAAGAWLGQLSRPRATQATTEFYEPTFDDAPSVSASPLAETPPRAARTVRLANGEEWDLDPPPETR